MMTGLAESLAARSHRLRNRERKFTILVFICAFVLLNILLCSQCAVAFASNEAEEEVAEELADRVDGVIGDLDSDLFQDFVDSLGREESDAVGVEDLKAALKSITEGEPSDFFGSFMSALASAAGSYFLGFLPGLLSVVIICLLKSMLTGLSSGFKNASTGEVVHIVCYSAIVAILAAGAVETVISVTDTVNALAEFSEAVFPVLLTLLAAVGGSSGVALYQPFMAVLSGTVIKLVQTVIIPAFIVTIVFSVVGNSIRVVCGFPHGAGHNGGSDGQAEFQCRQIRRIQLCADIGRLRIGRVRSARGVSRARQKRRGTDRGGGVARRGALSAHAACGVHPGIAAHRRRDRADGRLPHLLRARGASGQF